MRVIACYSMKGGVGKSATAVNLAYWAAKSGVKTLLIDLDPQGASSFYFRVRPSKKNWAKRFFSAYGDLLKHIKASDFDNLDIIPAHLGFRSFDTMLEDMTKRKQRLGKILKGLKKEYTLIVLDCPPTINNLAESVFTASNVVLVPVIPTTLSERTFKQLNDFFDKFDFKRKKLLPFFSMVQKQKNMHKATEKRLRKHYRNFLDTVIPFSADIENMGEHRAPVDCFARHRPANKAYFELWKEIIPLLKRS